MQVLRRTFLLGVVACSGCVTDKKIPDSAHETMGIGVFAGSFDRIDYVGGSPQLFGKEDPPENEVRNWWGEKYRNNTRVSGLNLQLGPLGIYGGMQEFEAPNREPKYPLIPTSNKLEVVGATLDFETFGVSMRQQKSEYTFESNDDFVSDTISNNQVFVTNSYHSEETSYEMALPLAGIRGNPTPLRLKSPGTPPGAGSALVFHLVLNGRIGSYSTNGTPDPTTPPQAFDALREVKYRTYLVGLALGFNIVEDSKTGLLPFDLRFIFEGSTGHSYYTMEFAGTEESHPNSLVTFGRQTYFALSKTFGKYYLGISGMGMGNTYKARRDSPDVYVNHSEALFFTGYDY